MTYENTPGCDAWPTGEAQGVAVAVAVGKGHAGRVAASPPAQLGRRRGRGREGDVGGVEARKPSPGGEMRLGVRRAMGLRDTHESGVQVAAQLMH